MAGAHILETIGCDREWHIQGRQEVVAFLTQKWKRELGYRLRKNLWTFTDGQIAVRFQHEWHDADGQWYRAYGNELWKFDADGYMVQREVSINDVPISDDDLRVVPGQGQLPTF